MLEISNLRDAEDYLTHQSVVIFDLDDTLYSEKDYVRSGYAEIAQHYKKIDNMENKLWFAFQEGKPAINYVLQQEGIFSDVELNRCLHIYRNHQPRISLYHDAQNLLISLTASGVRLGMITDGRPEGQRAKIKALGIAKYFDKIIITDELGGINYRKPNKTAFEKMQVFFNVPYTAMVYVGDNLQKDFIAPQLLGIKSLYFNNYNGLYCYKGS